MQFAFVNPGLQDWLGGFTAKNASELMTGILAKINSDGTLQAVTADEKPDGFVFTNRVLVYDRLTKYADAAEPVTLVRGPNVRAFVDSGYFYNATLPSFGAMLYTAGNGLLATSGAAAGYVGKVIGTDTVRAAPNTTANLVEIEAKFSV